MIRLNDIYQDRGIQKYNGFFLSEHTTSLNENDSEQSTIIPAKKQQSETLIFEIIDFAIFKNIKLAIQLNIRDIEGNFLPDVRGFVSGYDEEYLYLDDIGIPIDQIRYVVELDSKNWFEV